ncbi:MAG: Electron transfer flavoprotein alpha/beta-subunit [Pseudonocardiales bacterium]|nr:Electron transfer flavoprotein alpha/beta-subunit [Pseudonocardiales bacterium]
MKIVALIKSTPELTGERGFAADFTVDRDAAPARISELDEYAAEQALRLAEAHGDAQVTYLTMGPDSALDAVRKALSMGGDGAVHVLDDGLHATDAVATSLVLARAIEKAAFDVIVCGMASTDAGMGVVPAMVAERLGIAQLSYASSVTIADGTVTVQRDTDAASETVEALLPALVSVTDQSGEVRYPSFKGIMAAKKKPVEVWGLRDLELDPASVGAQGATTAVTSAVARPPRTAGEMVKDDGDGGVRLAEFLSAQRFI